MTKKKVIVVGSTGIIGKKVVQLLSGNYQIITVNRSSGNYCLDMQDTNAVENMFKAVGSFDALIATSGYGKWGSMEDHTIQDYHDGLNSKLMGQVNLVTIGRRYANKGACFVLTSGILAHTPTIGGISLSMINSAVEAFVKGAALEMTNARVNCVSPSFAKETMDLMGMDSSTGVPAIEFAKLYIKAIEEKETGMIYELSK
ncbi:MAG: short chain dehydrogenase [Bacteroidales bacterium]|jgi:NAD(P)-dependent dehydrogenase (short-subunit alcohol dehydrogenase family)|nr:short chain dehydrogenase [Bacteroidales bacterium]